MSIKARIAQFVFNERLRAEFVFAIITVAKNREYSFLADPASPPSRVHDPAVSF